VVPGRIGERGIVPVKDRNGTARPDDARRFGEHPKWIRDMTDDGMRYDDVISVIGFLDNVEQRRGGT